MDAAGEVAQLDERLLGLAVGVVEQRPGTLGVGVELLLGPAQVQASNTILRNYGNMSSATLPHVWQAMLEDPAVAPGRLIVALAFGPGLTIAGAILRKRA